jgi:hypothetical protein
MTDSKRSRVGGSMVAGDRYSQDAHSVPALFQSRSA